MKSALADARAAAPKVQPAPCPEPPGKAGAEPSYYSLVEAIYAVHNPKALKEGRVPFLFKKYRGQDRGLYLAICAKYKPRS